MQCLTSRSSTVGHEESLCVQYCFLIFVCNCKFSVMNIEKKKKKKKKKKIPLLALQICSSMCVEKLSLASKIIPRCFVAGFKDIGRLLK